MRRCALCGEPIGDHLPADEPIALEPRRQQVLTQRRRNVRMARVAHATRACPVLPMERIREDGTCYTAWVPRRLAETQGQGRG
jgi:hypothetical protein